MTQRIFDVNNPQEIFDLFPDDVIRIEKTERNDGQARIIFSSDCCDYTYIKINWRDKTEITRFVDESQWFGKLCWFWDENPEVRALGVLKVIDTEYECPYRVQDNTEWKHCCPVHRDEVQFVEDEK